MDRKQAHTGTDTTTIRSSLEWQGEDTPFVWWSTPEHPEGGKPKDKPKEQTQVPGNLSKGTGDQ
jgi:hypothetical protein